MLLERRASAARPHAAVHLQTRLSWSEDVSSLRSHPLNSNRQPMLASVAITVTAVAQTASKKKKRQAARASDASV